MFNPGRRLCFDTNSLIYVIDMVPRYFPLLATLFQSIEDGQRQGVVSVVTEAEAMIVPLRTGDSHTLDKIRATLAHENFAVVVADREIARAAARIRAEHNLKLPDAIIVATAIVAGCDALVGNDERCARRVTEIPYIYLDDVVKEGTS